MGMRLRDPERGAQRRAGRRLQGARRAHGEIGLRRHVRRALRALDPPVLAHRRCATVSHRSMS